MAAKIDILFHISKQKGIFILFPCPNKIRGMNKSVTITPTPFLSPSGERGNPEKNKNKYAFIWYFSRIALSLQPERKI